MSTATAASRTANALRYKMHHTTPKARQFHDSSAASNSSSVTSHTSLLDVIRNHGTSVLMAGESYPTTPHQQQQQPMFTEGAVGASVRAPSKPIRISPTSTSTSGVDGHDECSSEELERFYDQATWRMYLLIQSARQAALERGGILQRTPSTARLSSAVHQGSAVGSPAEWTCPVAVEAYPEEDGIFDLEL